MRRAVTATTAAALVLLAGCSSSGHGRTHRTDAGSTGATATSSSLPSGAQTASGAGGSARSATTGSGAAVTGPGGTNVNASGSNGGGGVAGGSTARGGGPGLPATTPACRLLTQQLADAVLQPLRPARTSDLPGLCAYATRDGKDVVNIGDAALTNGQTAAGVIDRELANRNQTGYRVTRVTVGGRWPGVVEDGHPYVSRVVWVQRGRNLTLTASPAGASTSARLRSAANTISATLGNG